jgi:hypothetical protein
MTPRQTFIFRLLVAAVGICHAADTSKPTEKAKSPEVVITFQRFVTLYGERHAEFALSNATPNSVWFTGYSVQSPIYYVEHLDGNRWVAKEMGWFCGTGLERREIPSHERTTFTVFIEKSEHKKTMRAGVWFSADKKYSKETEKIYWSEKVSPPKDGV